MSNFKLKQLIILTFIGLVMVAFFVTNKNEFDYYFYYTGIHDDSLLAQTNDAVLVEAYVMDFKDFGDITVGIRVPRVHWSCLNEGGELESGVAYRNFIKYFYLNRMSGELYETQSSSLFEEKLRSEFGIEGVILNTSKINQLRRGFLSHKYIDFFVEQIECDGTLRLN